MRARYAAFLLSFLSTAAFASDQAALDACIASWGKQSPFKKGTPSSSNVTVAGSMNIEAHCNAHIASAKEDGTSVGAVDQSNKGVAVFGALRVTRFDCPEKKDK
jgi:hypothetical protein